MLRSARELLDPARAPARRTVVGEGPQRRVVRALRRPRTAWTGWHCPVASSATQLRRLHHGADAYVSATRLEAFGIAALEARAAGLPVLALRGTGVDDFVRDGVEGLLADDDAGLAAAVARVAGDDGLRESLRQHVRAVPPAQDWDGVIGATLDEYHRAGVPVRVITVVGVQGERTVAAFALGHGEDPLDGLHGRGWTGRAVGVEGVRGRPRPCATRWSPPVRGRPRRGPAGRRVRGSVPTERRGVIPNQRVAAYAVVVADDRLLLTQLAARTGAGGRWNLPGGGLDPGEGPEDAVVREVLEETGQVVEDVRLVDVMTQHWIGRSPRGLEDYHAVRLLHTARCPRPTAPVVHDVGGSTADARWVRLDELGSVEVVASVAVALRAAGVADLHVGPQS